MLDGPQASTVGPDELGKLLDETGAIGTVTVNFATGTAQEAADFVAYMAAPLGGPSSSPADPGYWATLRARNGHPAPYEVPYWEVGNEQSFPGQYGWRSGQLVSLGPGARSCPPGQVPTCLYAFGGTTAFSSQTVGTFAEGLLVGPSWWNGPTTGCRWRRSTWPSPSPSRQWGRRPCSA